MGRLEPGFSHPWCKASPFFQKLTVETRIQPGPKLCMSYHCQPMWELLLDPIPTHNTCTQLSRSMQLFHPVLFPSDDVSIIRKLTGRDLLMTYTLLFQIFMLPQETHVCWNSQIITATQHPSGLLHKVHPGLDWWLKGVAWELQCGETETNCIMEGRRKKWQELIAKKHKDSYLIVVGKPGRSFAS